MLTKKDFEKIKLIIQEEIRNEWKVIVKEAVTEALTVEMTLEKVRDEKTGQPLAVKDRKTEDVFLPSLITQMISFYEGAFRGNQEQTCKQSAEINNMIKKVETMGQVLLDNEVSLKTIAMLSDEIKKLANKRPAELEYIDGEVDE